MPKRLLAAILALLAATPALAHPGEAQGGSLLAGLLHPLTGIDHLLALAGIGLWAARGGAGRAVAVWVPVALAAGFLLAQGGYALALVEPAVAASVVVFGLLAASALRLPDAAGLALSIGFALFHGHAHGSEAFAPVSLFAAGFLATSVALLLGGHALGQALDARLTRAGGLVLAGAGLVLSLAG